MDLKATARELIKNGGTPVEIAALLNQAQNQIRFEGEHAKQHGLSAHRMSDEDWSAFRQHLLDGGGAPDDRLPLDDGRTLRAMFWQAVQEHDQATVFHLLPHVIKSQELRDGGVRQLPGGGVARGPIGSNILPGSLEKTQ